MKILEHAQYFSSIKILKEKNFEFKCYYELPLNKFTLPIKGLTPPNFLLKNQALLSMSSENQPLCPTSSKKSKSFDSLPGISGAACYGYIVLIPTYITTL